VLKLRVAVRMMAAVAGLAIDLPAIAEQTEKFGNAYTATIRMRSGRQSR
jgi:hypothetical protein